jgi:hypothetical protein
MLEVAPCVNISFVVAPAINLPPLLNGMTINRQRACILLAPDIGPTRVERTRQWLRGLANGYVQTVNSLTGDNAPYN